MTNILRLGEKVIHTDRLRERNFAKGTDGYKPSHPNFYTSGIKWMYDYMESRGGLFGDITPFGAQAFCMKSLLGRVITPDQVRRASKFYRSYFGRPDVFNEAGWMFIAKELGGRPPLEVWALPEGKTVPVRTPILCYRNTHEVMDYIDEDNRKIVEQYGEKVSFLPGFMEPRTFHIWSPTTICTYSQHCKRVLFDALKETGSLENLKWMLHDFGYRGVSSNESAESGGAAHLVNFWGTDTIPAIDFINEFYGNGIFDEDGDPTYMPGFSVRATEHSVMTLLGRLGESEMVGRILKQCPDGIIAMVADSYDLWNFAEQVIGTEFRSEVIKRDGVVVIRPDSGDPVPTMMKLLWILGEKFGHTVNDKGYKILGAGEAMGKIKTLQGDKNTYDAIYHMCRAFKGAGWSLDNMATFGMGGALLQGHTRDEMNMAVKLSAFEDETGEHEVYKDPVTDPGKFSKRGRFAVLEVLDTKTGTKKIVTRQLAPGEENPEDNLLRPIYRNGQMLVHDDFETIRSRADEWMAA